jgi:acetyl esterase/lipase
MLGLTAYRPIVALLLAVAGLAWLGVVVKLALAPDFTLAGASEDFFSSVGFAVLSAGGAITAWIALRRASVPSIGEEPDPNGLWLGSALFGCVSFGAAVLALCGWLDGGSA